MLVFDPDYPAPLRELSKPPSPLFVRGPLDLAAPRIAIVGARRASEHGKDLARRIAAQLAARGVTIVSGGALGVDAAAHAGALDAGGLTWVVLPTPLDAPGPKQNRELFARVLENGGAWISERATPGKQSAFRDRNRIIAALAHVTLIVEARARSGTRYTAEAAAGLGRPLFVLPWAIDDTRGEAARAYVRRGASVLASVDQLLTALNVPLRLERKARVERDGGLLDALASGPATAEGLASALDRRLASVLSELTRLELSGLVEERGGRFFRAHGI